MNREDLLKLDKEELLDTLLSIITNQAERIAELEARLNMNSKNSSKPPSSDVFVKPKSLRKPSGKKPGGQKGHEGNGFKMMHKPDEYIVHSPKACVDCPGAEECKYLKEVICDTRYVVDINISTNTAAHNIEEVVCPLTGSLLRGEFPENITSTMQYGINLEALVAALNTVGTVSINRTHEILSGIFDVPISTGTISNMVTGFAKTVEPTVNEIKEALKPEPLIHNDETGVRVDGKNHWAHVASTKKLTHIGISSKRGKEGIDEIGILPEYKGISVHDCWASYFMYRIVHALCNAHLLRELIAVKENFGQEWAQKLIDLLLAMKQKKEELLLQNIFTPPSEIWETYSREYDAIIAAALLENPVIAKSEGKGKLKRGKAGALVDRLMLRKSQYLLFFTDFIVPFDNNQAERDIRMFKVKQKVSGCFRTVDGAKAFAAATSYISTARKNGINAFQAIRNALLGNPFDINVLYQ